MTSPSQQSCRQDRSYRWTYWLSKNWITVFGLTYGLFVGLPFLAPLLMRLGWISPAKGIYFLYSFLCHQLPERSFFLFGSKTMYTLGEIQAAWQDSLNPLVLRQFIGNPWMGWKVAWSDRMVAMYTSILIFGLLWWFLRSRVRPLKMLGFLLLILPMFLDGASHFISDLAGVEQGFRAANLWLAALTRHALPLSFYAGDALGSFNSWMRLLTGGLFGLGVVWFGFPYVDEVFSEQSRYLGSRLFPHSKQ